MTTTHATHSEDLLATYVSGQASDAERAEAETLVSTCTECRREVDLAVQARAALQSVPELHAPQLRVEGIVPPAAAVAESASSRRGVPRRVRRWSWERVAWGAGLVAAGSLVALFVFVQSVGGPSQDQAAAPQTTGDANLRLTEEGRDYTTASLDALARRLVASNRTALATEQSAPSPAAAPEGDQQSRAGRRERPRDCLRRGGGLSPGARPLYVEVAAFRGTPAFIGAFESGAPGAARYLLVLAVDRKTCNALFVINRSL